MTTLVTIASPSTLSVSPWESSQALLLTVDQLVGVENTNTATAPVLTKSLIKVKLATLVHLDRQTASSTISNDSLRETSTSGAPQPSDSKSDDLKRQYAEREHH